MAIVKAKQVNGSGSITEAIELLKEFDPASTLSIEDNALVINDPTLDVNDPSEESEFCPPVIDGYDDIEMMFEKSLPDNTRMTLEDMRRNNENMAKWLAAQTYHNVSCLLEYMTHAHAHMADSVMMDMCTIVDKRRK